MQQYSSAALLILSSGTYRGRLLKQMATSKCYVCGAAITHENKSSEHILPNCVGGRLKSTKLICRDCNSRFGHDIDKELCEQLNFFANRLNIGRRRGTPPPIRGTASDDSPFVWEAGQKPRRSNTVSCVERDGHRIYNIIGSAGSKELQRIVRSVEQIPGATKVSDVTRKQQFVIESLAWRTLGGNEASRSILKIAVNFWMLEVGDRSQIAHLIPCIRGGRDSHRVSFCYLEKTEDDLPEVFDEVVHRVLVKGDHKNAILYSLIELFSAVKYLVLLNDDYKGPDIKKEYSWDVLHRKKISQSFDFSISRDKLLEMMEPILVVPESMQRHLRILLHTAEVVQICRELEQSFKKCAGVVSGFVDLPISQNNLHAFALGREGFLVLIFDQMLAGFVRWVDPATINNDPTSATRCFLALRGTALEIAKTALLKKYRNQTAMNRESLLAFTVELLSQISGFMGGTPN